MLTTEGFIHCRQRGAHEGEQGESVTRQIDRVGLGEAVRADILINVEQASCFGMTLLGSQEVTSVQSSETPGSLPLIDLLLTP